VGLDNFTTTRFTYGMMNLMDGIGVVPILMGLFGIPEVLINLEHPEEGEIFSGKIKGLLPTLRDWIDSAGAMARGTLLGFFVGILPGGGRHCHLSWPLVEKSCKRTLNIWVRAIQEWQPESSH
jgi:putative tricarboxylic transport membrane protein